MTEFALEEYYDLTLVTDATLSPDGSRVAFVADEFDAGADERRQAVFVAPTSGARDPHRLTRASGASAPKWSPDGSRLAVLAERDDDFGLRTESGDDEENADEEPESQVWVFDLELGGDARQVTDFEEGAREFDWGPEGDRLVVTARDPTDDQREYLEARRENDAPIETERLQHKFDGQGWLDDVRSYLFVVNVDTHETTRLDGAHGGEFEPTSGMAPRWSPNGEWVAFFGNQTANPDDSSALDVFLVNPDGREVVQVTDKSVTAVRGVWSPDGTQYAFVARNPDNWYEPAQLYVVSVGESVSEPRSVSRSIDRTFARGAPFEWVDDETLLGAVGDAGRTRLVRFRADEDAPERVFERQGQNRTIADLDTASDTVALVASSPDETPDVFALDVDSLNDAPESDSLRRVSHTNSDTVEEWPSPTCHRLTFENDGETIEGFLYAPEEFDPDAEPDLPLVVSIHGGPVSYDEPEFGFGYTYWVNEGYLVLRVNYRGSTSYGQAFSEAIAGNYGNKEPSDVVAGIETVIDRGWADSERVCVTGFSYGGAQTAYILTQYDVATVGAAEHGVYDRASYFGTGDSHNRMERDFGLPWENPDIYNSISSITDVDGIDAPLLLTAGGDDWRCPPSQSEQLYVSVKKQGVPARLVVYPDEHHNVGDPDRAVHRLRELTDWFERHG